MGIESTPEARPGGGTQPGNGARHAECGDPRNGAAASDRLLDLATEGLFRYELAPPMSTTLDPRELTAKILEHSRLTSCNLAYARSHGRDHPRDMIGTPLSALLAGSPEEQTETILAFIGSGFRLVDQDLAGLGARSSAAHYLTTVTGVVDHGFLIGCQGRRRDVTEEQALRTAVGDSEETMRVFIQAIPEPALLMTVDGTVLVANPAMSLILGVPLEELLGHCVYDTMPEDLARLRRENVAEVVANSRPVRWEDNDGPRRYLNHVYPVPDTTGRIVRVAVCAVDITERKGTEDRLLKLAAAVEHAADDIILLDTEGRIQYVNPSFERTTGYSSDEVLGRSPRFLDCGDPDEAFYRTIEETVTAGRIWKGRFTNRTKDGRVILQDANIAPILDATGRIVGQVSGRRDVTREVEVEKQAAEADKLQAIGTLAGGIAHDFNNLLGVIIGNTQMAQRRAPDDERLAHNLESVGRAATRAAELVRQILAFSRQGDSDDQPVQAGLIVKEAVKFFRSTVPTTMSIECDVRSESLVQADPVDIRRIVVNLCTNAVRAMRDGGGTLRVSLDDVELEEPEARRKGVRSGRFLRLRVEDSGCGMTEDVVSRVFEPFYSAWDAEPGAGMGLSVVHGIAKRMQGSVDLQTSLDGGTTFEVALPVRVRKTQRPSSSTLRRGSGRVFVVDDEEMVRAVVSETLSAAGFQVTAFPNAVDALEAFTADPGAVDIVVTDMTMPRMTGDQLTKRIKAVRPELPIVLCTGFSEKISAEGARSLGVEKFLMKPVDMFELAETLMTLLAA